MNICIYGASSDQIAEIYKSESEKLGEALAQKGHALVFGGGPYGVMAASARGFYKGGGKIIAVTPTFFTVGRPLFPHCDEIIYTETMRQRKEKLEQLSDAFIAAPGGIGTMDELFEIFTLRTLNRHQKPVILWNLNGCYDRLIDLLSDFVQQGFLPEQGLSMLGIAETVEDVLKLL